MLQAPLVNFADLSFAGGSIFVFDVSSLPEITNWNFDGDGDKNSIPYATRIQAGWRMYASRKQYHFVAAAALKIKAIGRMHIAIILAGKRCKEAAALKI